MLLEPAPSPYDLSFRLFGFPVRVSPMFWLFTAILGFNTVKLGFEFLLIWIACAFLSILVHELGHGFMARFYGEDGRIVLYSFGGLLIHDGHLRQRSQRILISLAGPAAGFVLFGLTYLAMNYLERGETPPHLFVALFFLWQINLFWNLMNLLPVWPLDGGKVTWELCNGSTQSRGRVLAWQISLVVAGLFAVNGLMAEYNNGRGFIPYLPAGLWTGILFGLLAFESYQLLQYENRRGYHWGDDDRGWRG